jgi:hypothetical protein
MKKFLILLIATASLWSDPLSWERLKDAIISQDLPTIPGWCSKELADRLMDFIYQERPLISVEIGSFAGSTTYPIAQALKHTGKGVLYAVDAWDNGAVYKGLEENHPYANWWRQLQINMDAAHKYFISLLDRAQLMEFCYPVKMISEDAVSLFGEGQIDFLYIDGNHSAEGSLQDVTRFFPKVKKGGYIWLVQADSPTKNQATTFLMRNCDWVKEKSLGIYCLVFRKR